MGFNLGKALGGAITGFVASGGNPVGAIIGAGAGGLSSYSDRSDMKFQQKQNIKLWNMQNAYNTPKAQMQRFMAAGLNPNLIYSQSNEAGSITPATLGNTDSGIGDTMLKSSQNRLNTLSTYSNLASAQAQREYTYAQTENVRQNMQMQRELLPYRKAMLQMQAQDLSDKGSGIYGRFITRLFGRGANSGSSNTADDYFNDFSRGL